MVRAREVSPVELAETFLGRLESLGPGYNAVVTMTRERAMQQARRAEQEIASGKYRGPLHGIPYGAKDVLATSGGIPTTWGAAPFQNQTFDFDATVIRKLEEAGAVLTAKLALVEMAGGMRYRSADASFTGPGLNPWDRTRWSGGSSSGPGSAVAAGLVPFAIGSETGGSILGPAVLCGIAGLRPTYGRVSGYGGMVLTWTMDKIGPMCQTADDCGLVLDAIAGPDPNDPATTDRPYSYDGDTEEPRHFRLGVLKNVTDGVADGVRENFERALKVLEQTATIEEVEFPEYPYGAIFITIETADSASAFDELAQSGQAAELTDSADRYGPYSKTAILATDYIKALRLRAVIAREVDRVMAPYDALVAPTESRVAPPIAQSIRRDIEAPQRDIMFSVGNAVGLPAISVPNGFAEAGLPTGIQFMGRAYADNITLAVARAYQSLTDWHKQHPPDLL
jgi:aspartyl-tRNA(Asn)/glutamyl-tRNA(Gln) amidotransferase subunit A